MLDREKEDEVGLTDWVYNAIRTLEDKIAIAENNDQNTLLVTLDAMKEILALLKEQEAVEPKVIGTNSFGDPVHACGKCGLLITESMNYCHECGRKVKWDE